MKFATSINREFFEVRTMVLGTENKNGAAKKKQLGLGYLNPPAYHLRGEAICLEIPVKSLPETLMVPEGSILSIALHQRILSAYLFGDDEGRTKSSRFFQSGLPPLLVEGDQDHPKRLYKKRQFAAYLWKKILRNIAEGLRSRPFNTGGRDQWIFRQLLGGIAHIQHSLQYLESHRAKS